MPPPPRESTSQEEYTITFRTDLPVDNFEETRKYTSNKDCPLPRPRTYGYKFAGWEDENHHLIQNDVISKNTVARDIILTAKWISDRNKYCPEPIKKHSIIEDEEDSKFFYVYKVGRIENVPLEEGQKLGHRNQGESFETTTVEEREFTTENAKTVSQDIQRKSINSESVTLSTTTSKGSSSTETKSSAESKTGKDNKSGWEKALNNVTIPVLNIKASTALNIVKPIVAIFKPESSKKNANAVTSNQETIDKISNTIEEKESNSTSKTNNTSESNTNSKTTVSTNEYGTTERNSSTITYTEGRKLSKSEKHTIKIDHEGNYREVVAGTVHIYKIVGYNLKTKEIFTFDHYRIDNEIHSFLDYSFDSSSFNDRESKYDASFVIPEEVFTHISDRILETEGLLFNTEGSVEEYDGESDTVLIPEYSCIAGDEEEDGDVIKVTSIEPGVFKDNKDIKRVVLSDFITEIPEDTFDGCESLEYVLGGNISKIGNNAFRGCKSLKKIAGDNIIEIGDSAFSGCQSLEKYTISSKVESIGQEAFKDVPEIIAKTVNEEIVDAIVRSGAKKISIHTNSLEADSLSETKINIPSNIEYFYFGENGSKNNKTFKNFTIESYAKVSTFENINFISEHNIPLKLHSQNVQFLNINIASTCTAVLFYAKDVTLGLFDTIEIKSNNEYAILSKGINPKLAKSSRRGVLVTTGKIGICGNKNNLNKLQKQFKVDKKKVSSRDKSADIVFINEQQFEKFEREQQGTGKLDFNFDNSKPKKPVTGRLNFDSNGGEYIDSREYTVGKPLGELPTPAPRNLYSFDGWYTDSINGQIVTKDTIFDQGGNIFLYAHWKQDSISDWTLAKSLPKEAMIVEEKWTYDEVEYRTSSESYLPGWERYDVEYRWGDYGRWSDWQRSFVSNSETRQVDTRYVEPKYYIQYNYSRYRPLVGKTCSPRHGFFAGRLCVKYQERGWGEKLSPYTFKGVDAYKSSPYYVDEKDLWFNETTKKIELTPGGTEYRYRDRSKVASAYHYKRTQPKESLTEVRESKNITNIQVWVKYIQTKEIQEKIEEHERNKPFIETMREKELIEQMREKERQRQKEQMKKKERQRRNRYN